MDHESSSMGSSSTAAGDDYEVFLSFRGPDTRTDFTDHLYHSLKDAGIHVFRDDEELHVGQDISGNLTDAINKSKISLPVFSESYASSKWCLNELARIAHLRKTSMSNHYQVMPIFYHISPSHVRNQTGTFGDSFVEHQRRFSEDTIGEWRRALKAVGALKGWEITKSRQHEAEVIKEIVNAVLRHLKKSYMEVSDFVVGVEDHVKNIKRMISLESSEVQIIVIHGTGGIGKTTLAKIIYNQLSNSFGGCSFLANVRETSDFKDAGIIRLQNQLIYDILKSGVSTVNSVDEGIATIKQRLSRKKVFICFDDVSKIKQLKALVGDTSWFGPGSKIIITSRNKELLNEVGAYSSYEVTEMDSNRSLQLFSKHAFRRDSPPLDYMTYSQKVVKLTGGLPLGLEVIGSLLHGKSKDSWEARLEKLEKVPHEEVKNNLMISYEELDDHQKQIFLDVACFFVGFDKTMVLYFWDSHYPREGMEVLEHMSLLRIKKDNTIWMHDQLVDFGRSITYQKGDVEKENRSRLCVNDEAISILKKGQKEERVEAMLVLRNDLLEFGFKGKVFTSVPNLTVLSIAVTHAIRKKPRRDCGTWRLTNPTVLPRLRWLSLCNLDPQWLRFKLSACNLIVLDLSSSRVTNEWDGWSHIKVATNLKVLNLTGCINLRTTPDLSAHVKLERLILCNCTMLVHIDKSVGRLKRLLFLDLSGCIWLQQLPEEIGQLESLIELVLTRSKVEVLPRSVGNIKRLKVLRLNCSHITELPTSIGRAENLEEIYATGLIQIPSEIGRLSCLITLKITDTNINQVPKLPDSLIYLHLHFDTSKKSDNEVPDLSNLVSLRELDLKLHDHRKAPSLFLWWIGRLSKLETLSLTAYNILRVCAEDDLAGSLSLLKTFHLKRCYKLQSLPVLPSSLRHLTIRKCKTMKEIRDLPSSLLHLKVKDCSKLQSLPTIPSSLVELHLLECRSLKSIGDISNLRKLSTLSVSNCAVTEIRGLDCLENLQILSLTQLLVLERLPEDLSRLSQLKKLTFCELKELQILPRLPSSLSDISITHCEAMAGPIDVSNMNQLFTFRVAFCSAITKIRGLPSSLAEFAACDCEKLKRLPKLPQNLVNLDIDQCPIKMLDVSNLTELEEVRISGCPIKEIRGLHCLVNLSVLSFNSKYYSHPELAHLQRELTGEPFYLTVTN